MSLPTMLGLNAYWVATSFMWNALHPILLPILLLNFIPPAEKNTYLGLLTFVGLLLAMVVQPVSGAISDTWVSPHGRRRPLIAMGTILSCVFLVVLGWSRGLLWLVFGYAGLQLASNTAQGPLQGLLRDRVPVPLLGRASSLKVFLELVSLLAAGVVIGRLMGPGTRDPFVPVIVCIGLLVVCAFVTIFFADEDPTTGGRKIQWPSLQQAFTIEIHRNPSFACLIAERTLFLLGVYGLQVFGQYYLQDVLRVADPPRQTASLLAATGAGTVLLVLLGGMLSDRYGAKRILYAASALTAVGLVLTGVAGDATQITWAGSVLGAGIGLFLTSNWALANTLAPPAEAGKFLGLTNIATAGSAALARLQGPFVDFLNAIRPQEWLGYKGMFLFGIVCIMVSILFLRRIDPHPALPGEMAAAPRPPAVRTARREGQR